MVKELKSRVSTSKAYPKVAREVIFLERTLRYLRCRTFGRNDWEKILSKPPTAIGCNVTGLCNARCSYCAYRFHKPDGIMPMQVYEKAVKDFSQMGGRAVGFSPVTGEPLLDPLLMRRIEFASQFENIEEIGIETNGIQFQNEEIIEGLIGLSSRIRIKIGISLPGFEEAMYQRIYGVGGYHRVLYGVQNLLKANSQNNGPLNIRLVLQPDRGGILQDKDFRNTILPYLGEGSVEVSLRVVDNWCGQIRQEHLTGDMILLRPLKFRSIPCQILLEGTIDVLVNGDVRFCGCRYGKQGPHDSLVIGNIMEKSLSEIWFGDEPKKICEGFLKGELPEPCQECSKYEPLIDSVSSFVYGMVRKYILK